MLHTLIGVLRDGPLYKLWLAAVLLGGLIANSVADVLREAERAAAEGRFLDAARGYQKVLDTPVVVEQLQARWGLADVYRQQGKNRASLQVLKKACSQASTDIAAATTAIKMGSALYGLGRYEEATQALIEADKLKGALEPVGRMALLLEQGNLAVERNLLSEAGNFFRRASALAREHQQPLIEAKARLNSLRLQLDNKDLRALEQRLRELPALIATVEPQRERAALYLALGELYQRSVNEYEFPPSWRLTAYRAFRVAIETATDLAAQAYAMGFVGSLYEDEGRYQEALSLTHQAIFLAQQAGADEQIYRWEWQAGRLLRASGELQQAHNAYQRAVDILNRIRPNFALGSRQTFNRLVAPVYSQLADIILLRTSAMTERQQKQQQLRNVRELLETLKKAEVEDYFGNQCLVRTESPAAQSVRLADDVAVVYPVFLDRRIEVLVEAGGNLAQFTTPIGRNQAMERIRQFRLNLERQTSGEAYMPSAQDLYRWLMAPAEDFLKAQGVNTLVIIPEGALRTVSLAALHDGRQFLIERFAVTTTPAIKLTRHSRATRPTNLLIGGLSEGVQGFDELPGVKREIDNVVSIYPGRSLRDASFQLQPVRDELENGDFSVAHFATHGEFNQDHRKSFILTYDNRLTLNGLKNALQRRGDVPLDLLVLSACKTAAGDDRAALGLAGVAVQSGALSALASLWSISDRATAELISNFYRQLKVEGASKAESLRQAQLSLLRSEQFDHPSYWAPYLLVGNWL